MTENRLIFDVFGRRWEYVVAEYTEWAEVTEVSPLLRVGRTLDGTFAGFLFDHDPESVDYLRSLAEVRRLFGDEIADVVSTRPTTDLSTEVMPRTAMSPVVPADRSEVVILPTAPAVNGRATDVEITEDSIRRVITVSMNLPWWARFLRPWVTVRRRGRAEILAVAPLRFRGRRATAQARYGLPNGTAGLVADVVKGPRRPIVTALLALILAALLIIGGQMLFGDDPTPSGIDQSPAALASETTAPTRDTRPPIVSTTVAAAASTTPPETSTTASPSTTTSPRRSTTTSSTLFPPGGVSFETPDQYVSPRNKRAALAVERTQIARGETLRVRVKISGIDINPFERSQATTVEELIALCRETLGVPTPVVPVAGWRPLVYVVLRGPEIGAGGPTQLYVVGNIARECGDSLTTSDPLRISVVRMTYYGDTEIELTIPRATAPGSYQLDLLPIDFTWDIATPLTITVTD